MSDDHDPECLEQRLVVTVNSTTILPATPCSSNASGKSFTPAAPLSTNLIESPRLIPIRSSWKPISRIRDIVLNASDDPFNFIREVHWWPLRYRSESLERAYLSSDRIAKLNVLIWQSIIVLLVWICATSLECVLVNRTPYEQPRTWLFAKFSIYVAGIICNIGSLMLLISSEVHVSTCWYFLILLGNLVLQNMYIVVRTNVISTVDGSMKYVADSMKHISIKFFTLATALIFVNNSSFFPHRETFMFDILCIMTLSYLAVAVHQAMPVEVNNAPRFIRVCGELNQLLIVVCIFGHYLKELDNRAAFLDRTGVKQTLQKYGRPTEFYLEHGKSMAETLISKIALAKTLCQEFQTHDLSQCSGRKLQSVIHDMQRMIDLLTKQGTDADSTILLNHLSEVERQSLKMAGINTGDDNPDEHDRHRRPPRIEKRLNLESPPFVILEDIKTKYEFRWPANVDIGLDLNLNLPALVKRSTALTMETCRVILNRYGCKTIDHRKIYQLVIGISMLSPENPYSNVFRTVQATHILFYLLEYYELTDILSDDEIAVLLIASFGRYIGHGGVHGKNFYRATNHRLTTLFNDDLCEESIASFCLSRMLTWPECRFTKNAKISDLLHELIASLYMPDHFVVLSRCRMRLSAGRLHPEENRDDLTLLLVTLFKFSDFTKEWTLDRELRRLLWFASRQELNLQFSTERKALMEYNNNLIDHGDWFSQAGHSSYVKNVIGPMVDLLAVLTPVKSGEHTILGTIKEVLMVQECWPPPPPEVIQKCKIAGASFPILVFKCVLDSANLNDLIFNRSYQLDHELAKQLNTCITRGLAVRNALHLGEYSQDEQQEQEGEEHQNG